MEVGEEFNVEKKVYRKAEYFADLAKAANKSKLINVFKMIDSAAANGQYQVVLGADMFMNEDQINFLEDLNFDIQESEDDNNERINIINFEQ